MPVCKTSVRSLLRSAVLVAALALPVACPLAPVAYGAECQPDDQECKDKEDNAEAAKKIEGDQKKTQEAAAKVGKDIEAAGKKLEECPPGSASCMEKLAGKGGREEDGFKDMGATISAYEPEPSDNAAKTVETTCDAFPASLPQGSTDPGQSPFPASQLCSLLGP
ncbi:hypothetical protein MBT42_10495 [Streptomyces sp. MBT42]|uniref:hypothetical protein n=1 Tax=Streptomyces sp. MBT42 TaxID=1488373 RepID=UPI001E609063|nr:hypothetical protein [Streptomyces sp. MBT42]MCD2463990.1 hypothetical protein [Streptomyces sp. MBT42]